MLKRQNIFVFASKLLSSWPTEILVDFVCSMIFLIVIIFLPKKIHFQQAAREKVKQRTHTIVGGKSTVQFMNWMDTSYNLFLSVYWEFHWHAVSNKIIAYKTKSKYTRTIFLCCLWGLCYQVCNTIWYPCVTLSIYKSVFMSFLNWSS